MHFVICFFAKHVSAVQFYLNVNMFIMFIFSQKGSSIVMHFSCMGTKLTQTGGINLRQIIKQNIGAFGFCFDLFT